MHNTTLERPVEIAQRRFHQLIKEANPDKQDWEHLPCGRYELTADGHQIWTLADHENQHLYVFTAPEKLNTIEELHFDDMSGMIEMLDTLLGSNVASWGMIAAPERVWERVIEEGQE